jgi:hypothetical protein
MSHAARTTETVNLQTNNQTAGRPPYVGVKTKLKEQSTTAPACQNCRFWKKQLPIGDEGQCRRFPSVPVVDYNTTQWLFPLMARECWCGEWQANVPMQ